MKGSIRKRYQNSWSLIVDLGYQTNPATGLQKRQQKWITFRGTKKQAQAKLTELLHALNRNEFVEPTKRTLGEWLTEWLDKAIKPPARRQGTYATYAHVIAHHVKRSPIAGIRLQQLKATDLKRYYTDLTVGPSTQAQHHAILHSALKAATLEGLVTRNVASLVVGKPRVQRTHEDLLRQCWTADEARTFLKAAQAAGPQLAAFFTLAIETGMRKGELCGLKWVDVDLDGAKIRVVRQLLSPGPDVTFGVPKNGRPRTIDLGADTVRLLRVHKRAQAELKMRNRAVYHDFDLMFAKEWGDLHNRQDSLGKPLQKNNIGQREFARIVKAAGVRAITFHGLRHTCATLLFQAGVPVKVIQERLGHKRVEITLGIYAHVLPSMQKDAAARLARILR
jgi:integrase